MIKLDLNFSIVDLDDQKIKGGEANKALAGFFLNQNEADALKMFDWALELNKSGIIEIDESDKELIINLIKKDKTYLAVLTKAQILKKLNSLK